MMLLFLYGTLLDPRVLAAQSGEAGLARRLRPARLPGWRRVALRGTPYPTLLPAPGGATDGAVLRAGPAALARLAAYEGPSYRLVPVRVETPRGPCRARAWIGAAWRADPARPWAPPGGERVGSTPGRRPRSA
ncbi:gamma-glutamylcyclotransferase family protein [Crenalkalicoccus roseus]|uniref:gamma-glutamylcyclotransferase family protein n=1 Tax=Crenalkalicoccus roseus TaxID=1485588 RepID=UPI00107FFF76|nr:gamma-glutamylcyclotransferase family protein [Crenalkalicoccus roseus]